MEYTDARLSALLRVLANSPQPEVVARALALGTLQAHCVQRITVHSLVDRALELRSAHGLPAARERMAARIPLDADTPEVRVLRGSAVLAIDDLSSVDDIALVAHHDPDLSGALLCLPILHEGRAIGVLSVRWERQPIESRELHELLDGVTAALALWLLTDARTAPAPAKAAQLRVTHRQQRVLDGLKRGLTNAAIAAELGFAIGTIKADITALNALFGATGREDLVRKAQRAGFSV